MNKLTQWASVPTLCLLSGFAAADALQEVIVLLEGRFDTHLAETELPAEDRMVNQNLRIDNPGLGQTVFYQQINHRIEQSVYRQRILILTEKDGVIAQKAYALKNPEAFVDAEASEFSALTIQDLDNFMPDGCEQVWTRVGDGYRGYVDPQKCVITSSRTGKLRGIEAESVITAASMSLVERGYDAETGEQLFGSAPGESYLLLRTPDTE